MNFLIATLTATAAAFVLFPFKVEGCPYLRALHGTHEDSPADILPETFAQEEERLLSLHRELSDTTSAQKKSLRDILKQILKRLKPSQAPSAAPTTLETKESAMMLAHINAAKSDIEAAIANNTALAAAFVRLSFHDCVGGCDGCVDLSSNDNRGLNVPMMALQPITVKHSAHLSRADIWALAGLTASTVSQPSSGTVVSFDMKWYGRVSCPNATRGPARVLPSAHFNTSNVMGYFQTVFNFSQRETVAILGAHTLGRAVPQNSGFDGRGGWVRDNTVLDNDYYRVLLARPPAAQVNPAFRLELQNNTGTPFIDQFMWRLPPPPPPGGRMLQGPPPPGRGAFMLNADMALAVDFGSSSVDSVNGSVTCNLPNATGIPGLPTCANSPTLPIALQYAANNLMWVRDFHDAFVKMTMNGYKAVDCGTVVCPLVPL